MKLCNRHIIAFLGAFVFTLCSPHFAMTQDNNHLLEQDQIVIGRSVPAAPGSVISGPPAGYAVLPRNEITPTIGRIAASLLGGEFGTTTPFSIGSKRYMARVEVHYHPPPPAGCGTEANPSCDPSKYVKPWGKHKGVTIFKAASQMENIEDYVPQDETPRLKLLQRIDDFYQALQKEIGN